MTEEVKEEKVSRYRSTKDGKFLPPIVKEAQRPRDWYKNLPNKNQTIELTQEQVKDLVKPFSTTP